MCDAFGVNNCGVLLINLGKPYVAFQLDFWTRCSSLSIIPNSDSSRYAIMVTETLLFMNYAAFEELLPKSVEAT
jgi:hypothetical protein